MLLAEFRRVGQPAREGSANTHGGTVFPDAWLKLRIRGVVVKRPATRGTTSDHANHPITQALRGRGDAVATLLEAAVKAGTEIVDERGARHVNAVATVVVFTATKLSCIARAHTGGEFLRHRGDELQQMLD